MFTGIITKVAQITKVEKNKEGMNFLVEPPTDWKVQIGHSISISGVCSTVKNSESVLVFEYMPETLAKSHAGDLRSGDLVNLEQSLRASDRLDGHIVLGHVDTVGKIVSIVQEGNSFVFTIGISEKKHLKLVAEKGSIAVEGISLTVVDALEDSFTVKIIPYTMEHTNLSAKKVNDMVNIEFDILAKYIQRLLGSSR